MPTFDRRRMLKATVLLAGTAAAPAAVARCKPDLEGWPAAGELVEGNDRELILETARALMVGQGNAALVTIDAGNLPRVRSVGTSEPEPDMTVWIVTHPVSRKVAQIRHRPEVALHYVDATKLSQVTLMGRAEVHVDAATLQAKNFYPPEQTTQWWPGFPEGYAMIAVRPSWLEISAPGTEIKGDRQRWRPAGLKL